MAFKVRKLDYRPWPVTVTQRDCQSDGSVAESQVVFIGHFKYFTEDDVMAARAEVFGTGTEEELAAAAASRLLADEARLQAKFHASLMCGWAEITDEAGQPLPWSEDKLIELATGPDGMAIRAGLSQALLEIRFGIAPQKNGSTSPAPGPLPGASEAPTS